jgi:putative ABC transport system permease protein
VVHDVMSDVFRNERDAVYLPLSERGQTLGAMFLRLQTDSPAALREIARQADAAGWVLRPERRLSEFLDEQMLPFSGVAALSGLLGGLALLMASVGLYGVMAFGVNQRIREIGIRMALGATAEKVVTLFVRQGMRLVGVGMALGLGASALFTLLLKKTLSGLPGIFDPWAFGGVTFLFVLIALTACWLPARRAAKVDPINALRAE